MQIFEFHTYIPLIEFKYNNEYEQLQLHKVLYYAPVVNIIHYIHRVCVHATKNLHALE